jgi:alpha-D-xyloside xylohydrolase
MQMDWSKLDLVVYAADAQKAQGLVCLPSDNKLCSLSLTKKKSAFVLDNDPLKGKVVWKIQSYTEYSR